MTDTTAMTETDMTERFRPSDAQIRRAVRQLSDLPSDWLAAVPIVLPGKERGWWTPGQTVETLDGMIYLGRNTFDDAEPLTYGRARENALEAAAAALGDRAGTVAYASISPDGTWSVFEDVPLSKIATPEPASTVERFIVVNVTLPDGAGHPDADEATAEIREQIAQLVAEHAENFDVQVRDPRETVDPDEERAGAVIAGLAACGLTCSEAERLADVLREAGHADVADRLIAEHGDGDDDADDEHHHLYNPAHVCGDTATAPAVDLPRDEYGHVETGAIFGESFLVRVDYTTDYDGRPVDETEEYPSTLHGPFKTRAEADAWIEDYPEADDVADWTVVALNNVRPEPKPEAGALAETLRIAQCALADAQQADDESGDWRCAAESAVANIGVVVDRLAAMAGVVDFDTVEA